MIVSTKTHKNRVTSGKQGQDVALLDPKTLDLLFLSSKSVKKTRGKPSFVEVKMLSHVPFQGTSYQRHLDGDTFAAEVMSTMSTIGSNKEIVDAMFAMPNGDVKVFRKVQGQATYEVKGQILGSLSEPRVENQDADQSENLLALETVAAGPNAFPEDLKDLPSTSAGNAQLAETVEILKKESERHKEDMDQVLLEISNQKEVIRIKDNRIQELEDRLKTVNTSKEKLKGGKSKRGEVSSALMTATSAQVTQVQVETLTQSEKTLSQFDIMGSDDVKEVNSMQALFNRGDKEVVRPVVQDI